MILKALSLCSSLRRSSIKSEIVISNFLIKILILHLQFLKSYLNFPFVLPTLFTEIFNIFSFSIASGMDKVLSSQCFFEISKFPFKYLYDISTVVAPRAIATIIYFVYACKKKCCSSLNSGSELNFDSSIMYT